MKTLIISNFRTGSWRVHDSYVHKGFMPLGEIGGRYSSESKIKRFKERSNIVGILHPNGGAPSLGVTSCLRLCEFADEIIYLHRQDTFMQTISYAVALQQASKDDLSPWFDTRKTYNNKISNEDLDNAFLRLNENYKMIKQIYDIFPSKVITLEKDLPYEPYPNKYNYVGDWEVPFNFTMLGQ
tara:strand:+ start:36 stop:584 length:549 start_codon:yes stop_codon:yes gene_type:complete